MKCNFHFLLLTQIFLVFSDAFLVMNAELKKAQVSLSVQSEILKDGWLIISSDHFLLDMMIDKDVPYLGGIFRVNSKFNSGNLNVPSRNSFYFRISGNLIFYSELKDDIRVIDSLNKNRIKRIEENTRMNSKCFKIVGDEKCNTSWDLCANNEIEKSDWICALNKWRGFTCTNNSNQLTVHGTPPSKNIIKKKVVKQPLLIIPIPSPFCNEKWDYTAHGDDWQCECKEGKSQSPLNIPTMPQVVKFNNKTLFDFFPFDKDEKGNPLKMIFEDNKVKIKGKLGSLVSWSLVKYEMYEVQFHTRSEHSIAGQFYDLEVQFYYQATTPGYIRKSAAVALLFQIVPGTSNLFFDKTINILDLPDYQNPTKMLHKSIDLRHLFLLNEEDTYNGFSYFQYEGSLTSPPCQEETTWYIVSSPLPISYTAVEYFKDSLKKNSLEEEKNCLNLDLNTNEEEVIGNYRNQVLCDTERTVYYYEANCNEPPNKIKKSMASPGHYEKIKQELSKYYYVNDDKPSGIPNSFVVSEGEAIGSKNENLSSGLSNFLMK